MPSSVMDLRDPVYSSMAPPGGWKLDFNGNAIQCQEQEPYLTQATMHLHQQYTPQHWQPMQQVLQHQNNTYSNSTNSTYTMAQQSSGAQVLHENNEIVSPKTQYSSIFPTSSAITQDDSAPNWASADSSYAPTHPMQGQSRADSESSYQQVEDLKPPSKKRRLDAGIDEMRNSQDVMIVDSPEQQAMYMDPPLFSPDYPQSYVGKGKGRAIEIEGPREVVWLD